MSGLFGVLRLPSPSVLALFVATVIAEVPVIIVRTVLTFAPSSTTIPSPSSGSPNTPTHQQSYA
jgi:hypothetical protein